MHQKSDRKHRRKKNVTHAAQHQIINPDLNTLLNQTIPINTDTAADKMITKLTLTTSNNTTKAFAL